VTGPPACISDVRHVLFPARTNEPRKPSVGLCFGYADLPTDNTFHPLVADACNFYKVEKWTRGGTKIDSLLYAGNNLGRARSVFERAIEHWPRIHVTIRQGTPCSISTRRDRNSRFDSAYTPAL
jgi:hypothetical protein